MNWKINLLLFFSLILITSCEEPIVDNFDDNPKCTDYISKKTKPDYPSKDTITVMTYNIRFGISSQILWFADACSDRTNYTLQEVFTGLDNIIKAINEVKPDVLLLQEVDVLCKRTSYMDQMQYILDNTEFKYGIYGSNWRSQYIASDGLGRVDEGNAILSKWPISNTGFVLLPKRGDIDALTSIFYVRENFIHCDINMPNWTFQAINIHLSAFSTDGTKEKQLQIYTNYLKDLKSKNIDFVTGGDFNLLPPGSDSTDYCDEDKCSNEHFHSANDNPIHKDGSNYTPEITWMQVLFDEFSSTFDLKNYKSNQKDYFTHSTVPDKFWDRTLDYLFASRSWVENSHKTLQNLRKESDHAPVIAKIVRRK